VDGVEDEAAALAEDADALADFRAHLVDGAEGQRLLRVDSAAQKTSLSPYLAFSIAGSIPAAEHCTGFKMSTPASTNASRRGPTAPQEWKKILHGVFRWTQSLSFL